MGKASPNADDISSQQDVQPDCVQYMSPSQIVTCPNDPGLLPVVHGLHSDVPSTEGEEQALYPPLSLQHQVMLRSHSHFLPEPCNLENGTRASLSSERSSHTRSPAPGL